MEPVDLVLRCYSKPKKGRRKSSLKEEADENQRVLVFDTETGVDLRQNLKFGSFSIYDKGALEFRGIFHGDVKENELATLQKYVEKMKTVGKEIALMTVQEYVDNVFLPEVYDLKTLCVGFNLPFDLSRIAMDWGNARKGNRGGFSFKLTEDPRYPRLIIKSIDSKRAFIQFSNGVPESKFSNSYRQGKARHFRGRFLDLKTMAFALTDHPHSLLSAGKRFGCSILKCEVGEHGKVTPEYVAYNINDVAATYDLYLHMLDEYGTYHLDVTVNKLYSPASIGKAYLDKMNVEPFLFRNPNFPDEVLGQLMSAFYGGRSEVRIRKTPVDVVVLDFLSMYPSVCILQDLWRFFIASKVEVKDDTEKVKQFLEQIDVTDLAEPETWKNLNAICLVIPDEDVLPARCSYSSHSTYNIGINYLTSEKGIWYSLADVIASKLLGEKVPKIVKAWRLVPLRQQRGLHPVEIIGGRKVDPKTQDFFLALMEYRHDLKLRLGSLDKESQPEEYDLVNNMQRTVKTIANATAYGIAVQVNVSEDGGEADIHTEEGSFTVSNRSLEVPGEHFNPAVAVFVTSAARLILAITEHLLVREGAMYAYCDTDGIGVPREHAEMIQRFFQKLSPYSFDDPVFKVEKEGTLFAISAKRYAMYQLSAGNVSIIEAKSHGLGHILGIHQKLVTSDDTDSKKMSEEVWKDIISYHIGLLDMEVFLKKYSRYHIISRLTINSPTVMTRFKMMNQGKSYEDSVKPFNFALVGSQCLMNEDKCRPIKPIAPFSKDFRLAPFDECIDYASGERIKGEVYWKRLDAYLWNYMNHMETKFDGKAGVLERKHLLVRNILYIGKESNRLEETTVLGVQEEDYVIYPKEEDLQTKVQNLNDFILSLTEKKAAIYGINPRQLIRWKNMIANGKPLRLYGKSKRKLEKARCISSDKHPAFYFP
jgi:hypothetical protein